MTKSKLRNLRLGDRINYRYKEWICVRHPLRNKGRISIEIAREIEEGLIRIIRHSYVPGARKGSTTKYFTYKKYKGRGVYEDYHHILNLNSRRSRIQERKGYYSVTLPPREFGEFPGVSDKGSILDVEEARYQNEVLPDEH
jgi:hypothetical protein